MPFEQIGQLGGRPARRGGDEGVNVVQVGFHRKQLQAMLSARFPDQTFGFGRHIIAQDLSPVFGNPNQVVTDLVMRPARFSRLQATLHLFSLTCVETVSIMPLKGLGSALQATLKKAQQEAARAWNDVVNIHKKARETGEKWPGRNELQQQTKGRYELHSQTVQMICHQLLANVDATRERRRQEPENRHHLKYPHKEKPFFPLYWPAQAVHYDAQAKRLVLPMGRGRKSLTFRVELDFEPQGVKLVWKDGYQLHLVRPVEETKPVTVGTAKACVDLGEIHQAAAVTDTGQALVVSGRGIRSQKRLLSKQLLRFNE